MDSIGRLLVLDTEGHRVAIFRSAHLTVLPVTVSPAGPVQSGQTVTMDVTVVNDGAAGLLVGPRVSPSLAGSFPSMPDAVFMDPGARHTFPVTFVTDANGTLHFRVSASGQPAIGRPIIAPSVSTTSMTVLPAPGPKMSLGVAPPPSPVGIGGSVQVMLTVSNTGTTALATVTPVVDVTPANAVSFTSMTSSSSGSLVAGAARTYTFNYLASAVGPVTFAARASATYADLTRTLGTASIDAPATAASTTTVTVSSDAEPPKTTIFSISPSAAPSGWYLGPVTVVLTATDNSSGVKAIHYAVSGLVGFDGQSAGSTATISITHDGLADLTFYAEDMAGNTEAEQMAGFKIDSVPPTIARGGVAPVPNSAGWNNTPPTVKFNASDATSGVLFVTDPVTVRTDGAGQIVTGIARDKAGNSAQTQVIVNVDQQAPALNCAPTVQPTGLNGWYKQGTAAVTIVCTATDQAGLSGLLNVRAICPTNIGVTNIPPSGTAIVRTGPLVASASCTVGAEGVWSVHGEATDVAGNPAITQPITIKIDRTPPVVTCGTASGGEIWPPNHKMVPWNVFVNVVDPVSGSAGFKLVAYSSSEAVNALGDGNTDVDMTGWLLGTPDVSGFVRAERSGKGTGRVYQLRYVGADVAGNLTSCTNALIAVPHDQGKK
jgi:hypothetical protein